MDEARKNPIVIALGGHALDGTQRAVDRELLVRACDAMTSCADVGLVVTHGNGPQIGRLAAQEPQSDPATLDLLGAQTEGMLGYLLEQELGNQLGRHDRVVSVLTRVEARLDDGELGKPIKPIGEKVSAPVAERLAERPGWCFEAREGARRRLVPSPAPRRTLQADAIHLLVANGMTVICAGGGGIPVARNEDGRLHGVEAVIDKDRTSALLGQEVQARLLVLATDVPGVYDDADGDDESLIGVTTPGEISQLTLPPGSMGAKVDAACSFVRATGRPAVIGSVTDLGELLAGTAGTRIEPAATAEYPT